jgi:hypothetical protein
MKKYPSNFRMALAAVTAMAISLGASCGIASAQDTVTSTNNTAPATPPVRVVQANPQVPALNYGVSEVVKMYQGGINKDIIVNYINSTALPYRLSADGIIYLQSLGMPQEITKAMLQRDGQLQQQGAQQYQQYYQQQPTPGPVPPPNGAVEAQPPVQVMAPSTPPPTVTVVGSDDYPVYDYGYPYYSGYGWPYYYGGPVVIGGFGGFRGGFHGGFGGFHGGFGGFHGGGGFGGGHGGGGHGGGGGHR